MAGDSATPPTPYSIGYEHLPTVNGRYRGLSELDAELARGHPEVRVEARSGLRDASA
jgi:hypothetical protein